MSAPSENPPANALANFAKAFQQTPLWMATAPGRVNLIGEHIDYNDGFVLPAAINRHFTALASTNGSRKIRIRSQHFAEEAVLCLDTPPKPDQARSLWMRYPLGVLAEFLDRAADVPGLDIWVESTVPLGSGLSSSAAFEIAFASILEHASGLSLSQVEKALLCQRAEHVFAGVPCGIMDQFASIMGQNDHLLLIDCQSQDVTPVPMNDDSVCLVVANTNVHHSLASSEYAKRKADCDEAKSQLGVNSWRDVRKEDLASASALLDGHLLKRARHVVTEIQRTQDAVEAIQDHYWEKLGELMYASHDSLAKDYEVSCPELDTVVAIAQELGVSGGVYGARMTGGGFGGSTISLVKTSQAKPVLACYEEYYQEYTGQRLDAFVTRPAQGAQAFPIASIH
ncbi:MAG: galactokinase [Verrucomicrobiales bacterium]